MVMRSRGVGFSELLTSLCAPWLWSGGRCREENIYVQPGIYYAVLRTHTFYVPVWATRYFCLALVYWLDIRAVNAGICNIRRITCGLQFDITTG